MPIIRININPVKWSIKTSEDNANSIVTWFIQAKVLCWNHRKQFSSAFQYLSILPFHKSLIKRDCKLISNSVSGHSIILYIHLSIILDTVQKSLFHKNNEKNFTVKESTVRTDNILEDQRQDGKRNYMCRDQITLFISLTPFCGITVKDACREKSRVELVIPEEKRAPMLWQ